MVRYIFIFRGSGSGFQGGGSEIFIVEVTRGCPPRFACPFLPRPHLPAAGKSRPGWARGKGAQEQTAAMQDSQTFGLPPQDCTVGIALCGYATNEADRDASMLSCSSRNAQAHNVYTLTRTHTYTHMHRRTHTRAHIRIHIHSSYSTQAARKASTRMQRH